MDIGLNIHTSIIEYKHAYENAGIEPPAYRITCKEHKALLEYLEPVAPHKCKQGMIAEYYGVTIEVVVIVEPYV